MARVYLSIGSNIERELHIYRGLDALAEHFGELLLSSVFESPAEGFDGEPFLNLVAGIDTGLSVGELSQLLRAIEEANGRQRDVAKFSSRTLDIDILTYDNCCGEVDGVRLPRSEVDRYAFVLGPLAELAPYDLHPQQQQTYSALWAAFPAVKKQLTPVLFEWRGQLISHPGAVPGA